MDYNFETDDSYKYMTGETINSDDVNYDIFKEYYKNLYDRVDTQNYNFDSNYSKDEMYEYIFNNRADAPSITDDYKLTIDPSAIKKRIMREPGYLNTDFIDDADITEEIETELPEYNLTQFRKGFKKASDARKDKYAVLAYKADEPMYVIESKKTNMQLRGDDKNVRKMRTVISNRMDNDENLGMPSKTSPGLRKFLIGSKLNQSSFSYQDLNENINYNKFISQKSEKRINNTDNFISDGVKYDDLENTNHRKLVRTKELRKKDEFVNDIKLRNSLIKDSFAVDPMQKPINRSFLNFTISNTNDIIFKNKKAQIGEKMSNSSKLYEFIKQDDKYSNIKTHANNNVKQHRFDDLDTGMSGYEFIKVLPGHKHVKAINRVSPSMFEVILRDDAVVSIHSKKIYKKDKIKQIYDKINYKLDDGVVGRQITFNINNSNTSNMKSNFYDEKPIFEQSDHVNVLNGNKSTFNPSSKKISKDYQNDTTNEGFGRINKATVSKFASRSRSLQTEESHDVRI